MRERQLAVFFRNNHFTTLFRFEDALYSLVTDLGYLHERVRLAILTDLGVSVLRLKVFCSVGFTPIQCAWVA